MNIIKSKIAIYWRLTLIPFAYFAIKIPDQYMTKSIIWKICCISVLIIAVLTFTPLITPDHKIEPKFLGMPYTLWVSILTTFILLIIIIIGSLVHPGANEKKTNSKEFK